MSLGTTPSRTRSAGRMLAQDLFLTAFCIIAVGYGLIWLDGAPAVERAAAGLGLETIVSLEAAAPALPFLLAAPLAMFVLLWRRLADHAAERRRRARLEAEAAAAKRIDIATGLPNEAFMTEEVARRLKRIERRGGAIALLRVAADDASGVEAGASDRERILAHTVKAAKASLRSDDLLVRAGDGFAIIGDQGVDDDAAAFAGRLADRLQEPFAISGRERRLDVAIGVATHSATSKCPSVAPEHMIMNAEIALDRARRGDRAERCAVYASAGRGEADGTRTFADELARGLENDEFEPYYQLQFDARTQDVVAAKALARWRNPKRGVLSPAEFLPLADEVGLAASIDAAILAAALKDQSAYAFRDLGVRRLSVNVSPARLADATLIASLRAAGPRDVSLAFELDEADVAAPLSQALSERIAALKGCGVEIDIHDFGAGVASIRTLLDVRPARIKLGRAFVEAIDAADADVMTASKAIVELAAALDVGVVATGVSTSERADALAAIGVEAAQGFAFARPMPADALAAFVEQKSWRRTAGDAVEELRALRVEPAAMAAPASPPTASPSNG